MIGLWTGSTRILRCQRDAKRNMWDRRIVITVLFQQTTLLSRWCWIFSWTRLRPQVFHPPLRAGWYFQSNHLAHRKQAWCGSSECDLERNLFTVERTCLFCFGEHLIVSCFQIDCVEDVLFDCACGWGKTDTHTQAQQRNAWSQAQKSISCVCVVLMILRSPMAYDTNTIAQTVSSHKAL